MKLSSSLLAAAVLLLVTCSARAEPVTIPATDVTLTADLALPAGAGPHAVVIALHGCGGMRGPDGLRLNARHRDWNGRLVPAGFAVLTLDSFTARGRAEICTAEQREITPRDRAGDVRAALTWLGTRADIDPKRIALLGWSHGAMSVLWSVRPEVLKGVPKPFAAIAYYPGCVEVAKVPDWSPAVPLTIMSGALDDWTPAAPCRDLAARTGARYIEYPGAYHGFDAPNTSVRLRTGLGRVKGGEAHVGTNPEARAASIALVMQTLGVK